MVLNALELPRPPSDATLGLGLFDQDNVFSAAAEAAKPRAEVLRGGMTLDDLGAFLGSYGLDVAVTHAADSSLDTFRDTAVAGLNDRDRFVLVNYLRSAIGQEKGGHISPLAAYDADTDRFLVLDVSRYKYPPIWVEAEALLRGDGHPRRRQRWPEPRLRGGRPLIRQIGTKIDRLLTNSRRIISRNGRRTRRILMRPKGSRLRRNWITSGGSRSRRR